MKTKQLNLLKEIVRGCKKCEELANTRIQTVFGAGNPNTKLVLLGEAPGKDEDLKGEPFVGRSGQLLDNILASINLNRELVYILNILKCRPPKNRAPTKEESDNCKPFLELQLKVINPKIIVCLGTTAAQNLLGTNETITNLRGQVFEYKGIEVIPTFHPSYALRNNSAKHDIYKDLIFAIEKLRL